MNIDDELIEEWFILSKDDEKRFVAWLENHPGYKFRLSDLSDKANTIYKNTERTVRNADIGQVSCVIQEGINDRRGQIAIFFTFLADTYDEGLLSLMPLNFEVQDSSFR